jgi:soluble lytic murein transglycosylase
MGGGGDKVQIGRPARNLPKQRVKSILYGMVATMVATVGHRSLGAVEVPAQQAGALLAAGQPEKAAELAAGCAETACRLVLGRALFSLRKLPEAAAAFHAARSGDLSAVAETLEGEALLLAGRPKEALEPLRAAREAEGPPGLRASALLADALLAAGEPGETLAEARRASTLAGQPPETQTAMAWDAAQSLLALARADKARTKEAALALRNFWLQHPEHPAAEPAREAERDLGAELPAASGRDLLLRGSRLLAAGQPAAAVAQAEAAAALLSGTDRAEAELLQARSLAADGKRADATPSLEKAWAGGSPHVAAQAGLLLARDRARRGRDAEAIQLADALARRYPAAPEAEESVLFTARLLIDGGKRAQARVRLAKLAARRSGPDASAARWMLAWMSYRDGLRDAPERFAEFAASGASDEERAQGLYWQARAGKPGAAAALFKRAAELDPLGWYGLLSRARLGQVEDAPPPFPPLRASLAAAPPARLRLGMTLASLGLLQEAAAEADWYVRHHPGDAGALALPLYDRAHRPDRALLLAEALIGGRGAKAPRSLLDAAYPAAYPEEVGRSGQRASLDPYFLLAVMRRESLFVADTRSAAGAVGLLQLLPATARRAAAVLGRPPPRDDELLQPPVAIDLGAWYLAELLGRFGDAAVALAAYNAGPRAALPWAEKGQGEPLDVWVEDIPYRETRRYVKIVVGAWSAYRILAGGTPPRLTATVPAPRGGVSF